MTNILLIIVLFIIGAMFGSFGGVLIGRERDKKGIKSILLGRSVCDKCGKTLSPSELIPVVSFIIQRGKCKNCGTKLPNFYWIIEILMGTVFVLTYLLFPYNDIGELVSRLAINRGFSLLIIVDYTKYELHLPMWIITTIIALIFATTTVEIREILIMTIVFVAIFLGIYYLAKMFVKIKYKVNGEGFGEGDIYLAGTIGILFPFLFWYGGIDFSFFNISYLVLFYIILSGIIGILYASIRYLITKNKSKELPFIPAMIASYRILLLFGNCFINMMF